MAMEEEQYRLRLVGGRDGETAMFTLFDQGDRCRLRCEYRDKVVEGTSTDFFEALCEVRNLLAEDGLIPFCYGASLNVFPSGMARDMGRGLKAYKLAVGRHAKTDNLVEIFAEGLDVIPCRTGAVLPRVACVRSFVGANLAMGQGLLPRPRPHDGRFTAGSRRLAASPNSAAPGQLPTCGL